MPASRSSPPLENTTLAGASSSAASFPLPPDVLYPSAKAALKRGEFRLAASLFEEHLALVPDHGNANINLGLCRFMLGEYERTIDSLRIAVELRPSHPQSVIMLGMALHAVGCGDEGRRILEAAIGMEPEDAYDRSMIGQTRILCGDYGRGWREMESRWESARLAKGLPFSPSSETPRWSGAPAPDATLCVHGEGGHGDNLMCARFLTETAERVGRLVVAVPPPLERLFRQIRGVDDVITVRTHIPQNALHTSFFSLPAHLGISRETLGGDPYLVAPDRGPTIGPRRGRIRVGIAWAGNKKTTHDPDRSIPESDLLRPLVANPEFEWISLQVGARAGEGDSLSIRPLPPVADFADTAYVMTQLDLVITVDTAVAHLAGALGIPVWIMLPTMPDFRWGFTDATTPWYRSAALFRRPHTRAWDVAIEQVRTALLRHLEDFDAEQSRPPQAGQHIAL